ncbi:ABC-2 type transport system ATP-binding protein [Lipingzhangella halophila]|uniref:ABC-2 type transport system ATP-binding protein n=1 Tax=Lipingzhangella halophila TaxID=1783352 RepID=A0A7W7RD22_9ACTN|nr:ATP-binding cassette domain-containing protein [Lipingzhangella halophila]MBB4929748.1 ABC-2 type transport system ATP-binding protein [Lipingzhangella halophila]
MIHTRALTKTFTVKKQPVEAVRGVDLDVAKGELVAFLGPNGAGKSTTLRMLTGLVEPTSGTATVAGHDVRRDSAGVRRNIGYIGQGNAAGHYHYVRDEMVTQGCAYGLTRPAARERADELLETLELAGMGRRQSSTLSGGQRRRLDVALGLMHQPPLLFLDEPSTGLDPQNRANLWAHVLAVRERFDTTLFLTTHYLEEADEMAERVVVIDHGRIIADDTPGQLKSTLAGDRITVGLPDADAAAAAARVAERGTGATELDATGPSVTFRVPDSEAVLPEYLRALGEAGLTVRTARMAPSTLDDVFLSLTGRSLREETEAPQDEKHEHEEVAA